MPPAYKWCVLTRYLGDPAYLPPVFVGLNGTAVYHVGSLVEETLYVSFAQKNFVPPIKQLTINMTVTNSTNPSSCKFHIPIPVDYREGLMTVSVNSSNHLVSIELWNEIIPEITNANLSEKTSTLVKKLPITSANNSGVENPSFIWEVNKWGYFTLLIVNREETFNESFSVTVDIRFYNYWDKESIHVP